MIRWNEGLNLGVETLDNDHKKLLNIINKLSSAMCDDETCDIIESIFTELEEYAKSHFLREETYLKDCGCSRYSEHMEQHRVFSEKIPQLKAKVLSSKDSNTVQEVSIFLTDWLLTHIIDEDIPAITLFKTCGLTKEEEQNNSLLTRLIKKTTDKFSFTKRIFLSAIIPLSGMLLFGTIIILANFNKYLDMQRTSSITHLTSNINELVHNLQIERGLSSGYLSSTKNKFKDSLQKRRKFVDRASQDFIDKMTTVHIDNILTIKSHLKTLKTDISSLDSVRKQINDKSISKIQAINFYSKTIKNLLDITPKIASLNLDRELSSSIATLSSIQHVKESLGQERAYGTIMIEKKDATTQEYIAFTQLLGIQRTFINLFEHSASLTQMSTSMNIRNSTLAKQINTYVTSIKNRDFDNLDSEIWFQSTTKYINKIKLFEDKVLSEINILIDTRIDNTVRNFLLWIIFSSIILAITLFILYTFKKSTVLQIDELTSAMKDLATGGRGFRLSPIKINRDELAYMYDAYETTRQKLLKGDIYTQLYLSKKELELKNKERENIKLEEMASIDPLTNCVNRRKFEELSSLELQRAIRYKSDLSFLMLDIDHFKAINDTYGHAAGDEVLKQFSHICLSMARSLDVVARIGGEEFVVMLPETDDKSAYIFAERFREKIFNSSVTAENKTIKYSVSVGISVLDASHDRDIKTILKRADIALYTAKESGRNTTIIHK